MSVPATAHDYTILGLRPSASLAEVEAAFQRLALEFHPQRNSDARAAERFQAVNDAYQRIRGSGAHRVYRVGEAQPEDASPAPPAGFVPFEQAHWQAEAPPPTLWGTVRPYVVRVQGVIALLALLAGLNFMLARFGADAAAMRALASARPCTDSRATDGACVLDQAGTVMATTVRTETPFVGDFPEGLRLDLSPGDQVVQMGVGRPDSGVAYAGLQVGDTVTTQQWRNHFMDVRTAGNDVMPTDDNPTVIASRHLTAALAWLGVAVVLGVKPLVLVVRRVRSRPDEDD